MNDRSDNGSAVLAVGVILILLLLLIGGGSVTYAFVWRQQAVAMQAAERAARNEAEAQMNLAQARALQAAAGQDAALTSSLAGAEAESIDAPITAMLEAQKQAWNAGDIDQFMEHYWKSDELTFSASGQTTRGWTATLNRYRERYPSPDKMGQLNFDNLEITPLGDAAALVLGQWHVAREPEPLRGNFSLVVRKFGDGWRIVHDHTSRGE